MNRRGFSILMTIGAVLLICAVVFAFNARRIALWAAGFGGGEDTAIVLQEVASAPPPEPLIREEPAAAAGGSLNSGERLETVTVNLQGRQQTLDTQALNLTQAEQTQTADGRPAYVFAYDEQDLNRMVDEVIFAAAPPEVSEQIRNVQVDLRQNAAVVSAEANLGLFWQPLSIVVVVDPAGQGIDITGVDIGGRFYSTPPEGPLADWIAAAETEGSRALRNATFVGPNGETLSIAQVNLTEALLQVVAR